MKLNIRELYPILFITLVVLISISLLAFTDNITAEQREWQREQRIMDQEDSDLETPKEIWESGMTKNGVCKICHRPTYDYYFYYQNSVPHLQDHSVCLRCDQEHYEYYSKDPNLIGDAYVALSKIGKETTIKVR